MVTFQFQYGNPDSLCGPLVEAKNAEQNLVVWISLFSPYSVSFNSFLSFYYIEFLLLSTDFKYMLAFCLDF